MSVKLTILGCGNSAGTPSIGNYWGACDPAEPKNRRTRPSIVVRSDTTTLLVDTSPDLREQANREGLDKIDAVIYTHAHSDHLLGIDELRSLNLRQGGHITPVYSTEDTIDEIESRFSYLFIERQKIYPKILESTLIYPADIGSHISVGDISFIPFMQDHGTCETLGLRFGSVAYSTDMMNLSDQSIDILKGTKTWIVDAAGYKMEHNLVHATLKKVFALNEMVGAEKVYLTHMPPGMDYQTLINELPAGYEPAWDGLEINID